MALAYWMGFLAHYALDSIAHPYIHYYAGMHTMEEPQQNGEKYNHKLLENIIDFLLSENFAHISNIPQYQYMILPSNPASLKPVYKNVAEVILAVYDDIILPDIILESVIDMKKVVRLMHDPNKTKRPLFLMVEKLIGKPNYITSAAYPASLDESIDYLNLQHKVWLHPCDDSITYDKSFLDLFEQAVRYTTELMVFAWEASTSLERHLRFMKHLGEKSYETGLKCGDPRQLRFSDSCFKET